MATTSTSNGSPRSASICRSRAMSMSISALLTVELDLHQGLADLVEREGAGLAVDVQGGRVLGGAGDPSDHGLPAALARRADLHQPTHVAAPVLRPGQGARNAARRHLE